MSKDGLLPRMKSNYIKIYIFSVILLIVPATILHYGIKFISVIDESSKYETASTLIKDDYKDIDLKRIKELDGIAQIVTRDLKTKVLCGEGVFKDGSISEREWNNYLAKIASKKIDTADNENSIAYSEKGGYWLIISYKNNAFITIKINKTTYESDNMNGAIMIVIILILAIVCYVASVFWVIYVYSYQTTKQLVYQIQALKDYAIILQNGEYKRRITMPMDKEILELKEAFNDLADCLQKEKEEKKKSEESKERLLLDISHDLNNPIATIRSSSEILMKKDEIDTIFEPFTRADESRNSKTGGSGLGLAIVKKIVESHGFDINLVTGINQGCTFIIEIPYKE